ncbi:MAG TPA: protein kinase [Gemmatimonadaceae bacterium]
MSTRRRKRGALDALERDFDLVRELGRGATSVVHLARERASGDMVAIKIIRAQFLDDAEALGRFAREARYVSRLDHPHVVRMREVRDLGNAGVALVMAHVCGPTLREHLQEHGMLATDRAEAILRDVASALAAAHDVGIAHRDVKPENIFLDESTGAALLADFGIARSMSGETQQLTMSGVAIGTPTYMAPEQIDGAELDGRGDVYSLGLTAWEMLTGHRPWEGEALYAVLYHQKHTQVADVREIRPDVPDRLASAIAGAIEKDRDARWQTAHQLLAALDGDAPLREWPSAGTQPMETVRVARAAPRRDDDEIEGAAIAAAPDFTAPEWAEAWAPRKDRRTVYRGSIAGLIALALVVTAVHARSGGDARAMQQGPAAVAPASLAVTAPVSRPAPVAHDSVPVARARRDSAPSVAATAPPTGVTAPSPPPPPELGNATRIVPGGTHTCLVAGDGIASCWGGNERGQLGSGGTSRRASPAPVSEQIRFASVAAGMWHSCGVARDGPTWCWGMNDRGQVGDGGGSSAQHATPARVAGDHAFHQVTTGASHSCALDARGSAWCWGANDAGQLGNGTTEDAPVPVRVGRGARFHSIVAGWRFTCALDAAGTAFCWGDGSAGQLGSGARADRHEPTPVSGHLSFTALAAGSAHACGITAQGATYCWGSNAGGQLGDGTVADRSTPTRVKSERSFVSIAAGAVHSCALAADGAAYCWGRNSYGQLGDGGTDEHAVPQRVAGGHVFASLRAFGSHSCGVTSSGEAFCWGFNLDGQLGDGSRTHRTRPVYVERAGAGRG